MKNNNENKILNVPNLRFPEFSEEWKKMKVSELLDFYSTNSLLLSEISDNKSYPNPSIILKIQFFIL